MMVGGGEPDAGPGVTSERLEGDLEVPEDVREAHGIHRYHYRVSLQDPRVGECKGLPLLGSDDPVENAAATCQCKSSTCCRIDCDCLGGCSGGDPHFVTHDRLHYDFQGVGEFVLAQSADGALQVQVRHVPTALCSGVAVNRAVATLVGEMPVRIHDDDERFIRLGDGQTFSSEAPVNLTLDGGRLEYDPADHVVQIVWDTGDSLLVTRSSWLNIDVRPAARRRGEMEGLLGNYDDDAENDLVAGEGVTLGLAPRWDQMVGPFADRWRVPAGNTLLLHPIIAPHLASWGGAL